MGAIFTHTACFTHSYYRLSWSFSNLKPTDKLAAILILFGTILKRYAKRSLRAKGLFFTLLLQVVLQNLRPKSAVMALSRKLKAIEYPQAESFDLTREPPDYDNPSLTALQRMAS